MADADLPPPPGVDVGVLTEWITHAGHDFGDGPITSVRRLTGGTQNISIEVELKSGSRLVLRRAGLGKGEAGDATILREARVLTALAGSEVPTPKVLAVCADRDVIDGTFYLMEFVEGYNPALGLRPPLDSDPAAQRDVGLSLVDAAAQLGRVDYESIGLADLGSGAGWIDRQIDRWLRYADSYRGLTGYLPNTTRTQRLGSLQDWLNANQPSEWRPGLIHGDLQFANVLVSSNTAQIAAVVDWELCTVGDPLLDLGHLLATWPKDPDLGGRLFGLAGLPTEDEVIAKYQATSGADLTNLMWFRVLAYFRLSIILEATFARSCAGLAKASVGARLHHFADILLNQGLALVTSHG